MRAKLSDLIIDATQSHLELLKNSVADGNDVQSNYYAP